jgi:hypothetical protein
MQNSEITNKIRQKNSKQFLIRTVKRVDFPGYSTLHEKECRRKLTVTFNKRVKERLGQGEYFAKVKNALRQ